MKRLMVFAAVLVLSTSALNAQSQMCSPPYAIDQPFPTIGAEVTRWRLCWQVLNGPNLVITGAWFRPSPNANWIKVLYDGRISQLFVPYHSGSPRYLDVSFNFPPVSLTTAHCPPPGQILGANHELCKIVHDRGLMWMDYANSRRGEEIVLWSALGAGNYNYIVEWTFRDDGVIQGRLGATGVPAGTQTHVHGPFWRLDIDLNGACCDTASLMSHKEIGATGVDSMVNVTTAQGLDWDPAAFDVLGVRDGSLTSGGKPSEWHLMPMRSGTPLHQEAFTKHAFWVTPYVWSQTVADALPSYVNGSPPTANTDIVVWYYGGLHHVIRNEDSDETLAMYEGFQLMPFNVWSRTPFYP
jgi:primary-amine oxidase